MTQYWGGGGYKTIFFTNSLQFWSAPAPPPPYLLITVTAPDDPANSITSLYIHYYLDLPQVVLSQKEKETERAKRATEPRSASEAKHRI